MPNDPAGQFPQPTSSSSTPFGSTPEVKLTDEIAPDLSANPIDEAPPPPPPAPPPAPPYSQPEPEPTPSYSPPPPPPPPVEVGPEPASLPPTRGGFPIISLLLLLIAVGAIAATYFFFQQTKTLTTQLTEVERTLERQRIEENQITPTPTPLATPTGTISATPTGTISATPTVPTTPGLAFSGINAVITQAQARYPNAQLIMVTATGVETVDSTIIKYWFRQTPTEKKYLYVLRQVGQPDSIVDIQVFVTPDNNIPSLNQLAASNGLGIDMAEAVAIAKAACPATFDCTTTPLSAQYIKANTTLWQVSYKPSDGSKPFVVQIDSVTKRILFKSI